MTTDQSVSPWLRRFFAVVGVIVLFGSGLLVIPAVIRPLWPWTITPFNAAFLGGVYISELVLILVLITVNRWSPARLVIPMAFCFVTVVTLVSLLYLGNFDFGKWTSPAWFVAYMGSVLAVGYFLIKYRRRLLASQKPPTPPWQGLLALSGGLLLLYGIGLLLLPATFAGFWPWKVDAFHAQVYSAVFLTGGLGSVMLSRCAGPAEFLTLGLTEVALGSLSIVGLAITDAALKRINWSQPGTILWLILFGTLFTLGMFLLREWRTQRKQAR